MKKGSRFYSVFAASAVQSGFADSSKLFSVRLCQYVAKKGKPRCKNTTAKDAKGCCGETGDQCPAHASGQ